MNPEHPSNAASSPFGGDNRGSGSGTGGFPSSSPTASTGGGGLSSLAQQLQYQQLLQQHQQQGLGGPSMGGTAGTFPPRDLVLEQIAAARQQALREAVLSQPYTLNSASLLHPQQHQQLHQQPQYPFASSAASTSSAHSSSSSAMRPFSSAGASAANAMSFLPPGLASSSSQLPPPPSSLAKIDTAMGGSAGSLLVQPGQLPPVPSSSGAMSSSLSREESLLVEEAVLRGLPLEEVFRAAGMSNLPHHHRLQSASVPVQSPPGSSSSSATVIARRLSSFEPNLPLGGEGAGIGGGLDHVGGGVVGGTGLRRSVGSPPLMTGLDPSHMIAQRELLLSSAAAASASAAAASSTSSSSHHGADPSWWAPPAKKSRTVVAAASDSLHRVLHKKPPKKSHPPSNLTLASVQALKGCSFPMPSTTSQSSGEGPAKASTQPAAVDASQSSSRADEEEGAAADAGDAAPTIQAVPAATGWAVGSLASFQSLWDKLDRPHQSPQQQEPGAVAATSLQIELFRRRLCSGSVPVDSAHSRSALRQYRNPYPLGDRPFPPLRRDLPLPQQQLQQPQASHHDQQQRALDKQRLLLLQLRARGL